MSRLVGTVPPEPPSSPAETPPSDETPSGVVREFYESINAEDRSGALACFINNQAVSGWDSVDLMIYCVGLGTRYSPIIISENIQDNAATVWYSERITAYGILGAEFTYYCSSIRKDNRWYLGSRQIVVRG